MKIQVFEQINDLQQTFNRFEFGTKVLAKDQRPNQKFESQIGMK